MSTDPDQIRREIDATREDLSDNVNALADSIKPGNVARRQVDKVKDGASNLKDRVMGAADDSSSSVSDAASGAADSVRTLSIPSGFPMRSGTPARSRATTPTVLGPAMLVPLSDS